MCMFTVIINIINKESSIINIIILLYKFDQFFLNFLELVHLEGQKGIRFVGALDVGHRAISAARIRMSTQKMMLGHASTYLSLVSSITRKTKLIDI
jgi:hypothetical protein